MSKTVLVTGAAGFIGYHAVMALLAKNYQVIGIDNINAYYDPWFKLQRIENLGIAIERLTPGRWQESSRFKNFHLLYDDIISDDAMNALAEKASYDYVLHLAAQPGVRRSMEMPEEYITNNIIGQSKVLDFCRSRHVQRLVYASSSSVYGANTKLPQSVRDQSDKPVSVYAMTKKAAEMLSYIYGTQYGIETIGLRFFTVYGPYGRPDMSLYQFVDAIANGEAIALYNHGDLIRDFTYIDDVIEGILRLAEVPWADATSVWKRHALEMPIVVNIGNSSPIPLVDYITCIEEALGKAATVNELPMQRGDMLATHADTFPLMELIGTVPGTNLATGVREFVRWYTEIGAMRSAQHER